MKKFDKYVSISVLMTAYNREKYIAQSIESVLTSTFKDFELIIVDDCSTDRTVEIAKYYLNIDSRISLYVNEENLGDYPNRKKAASLAKGKYIKYLDSDDIMYPSCLETMVRSVEMFNANFGLSFGVYPSSPLPIFLNPHDSYIQHFVGGGLFGRSPLSAIINRDFYNSLGGFNEERGVSDVEFWFRCASNTGVVLMQDGLTWAREHEQQESNFNKSYEFRYKQIEMSYLRHANVPLSAEEVVSILKKEKNNQLKTALIGIVKRIVK